MTEIVALRPATKGFLRCSDHPACEGPRLRPDHDQICDQGDDCDNDHCWRGCQFCVRDADHE